jgi:hypothetical protein
MASYKPPAGPAGRWVRTLVSLTVGVAVGLAPYLGTQKVPLFTSLLEMIPNALRDTTIPLSAACMGLVAVTVQWYGGTRISKKTLRMAFPAALLLAVVTLFGFMWIHALYVVRVQARGGEPPAPLVVGAQRQAPPVCGCPPEASDEQCINGLSWNEAEIAQCWGDRSVRNASFLVRSSYLLTTSAFGAVVGLLVLRKPKK